MVNPVRPSVQLGKGDEKEIKGNWVVPASSAFVERVRSSVAVEANSGRETQGEIGVSPASLGAVCEELSEGSSGSSSSSERKRRDGHGQGVELKKGLSFVGLNTAWPLRRLRGGLPENSGVPEKRIGEGSELESSEMHSVLMEETEVRRPGGWKLWEEDRIQQRPGPLRPPRHPLIEYADMTVNAIDNSEEGGVHISSPEKDKYRRTDAQVKAVAAAHEDQRNVAGGTYRCLEEGSKNFELKICRGYTSKVIGIVLTKIKAGKRVTVLESFASMKYEYFKFNQSGQRVRQTWPSETPTGFTWEGFGGNALPLPTSDIHVYCERVDRDIHFSGVQCSRVTESPGASQMLCSNSKCGVVVWHLSLKCFGKGSDQQFVEKWTEDFALVIFNDNSQELIWTHLHRKLKRSRWEILENSAQFEPYVLHQASKQRVDSVIARDCLPEYSFSTPTYAPKKGGWEDQEPLIRQKKESQWFVYLTYAARIIFTWIGN